MNDSPIRCFVAFDLPSEAKTFILSIIKKNQVRLPQARWVPPDQIHITLQFFPAFRRSRAFSQLSPKSVSFLPGIEFGSSGWDLIIKQAK